MKIPDRALEKACLSLFELLTSRHLAFRTMGRAEACSRSEDELRNCVPPFIVHIGWIELD